MFALVQSATLVLTGLLMGCFSLVALATFLIFMEGFDARFRGMHAR